MPHPNKQTTTSATGLLRQVPLLRGLDEPVLSEVAKTTTFRRFQAGMVIFQQNDTVTPLVILISGKAQVVQMTEDGRQIGSQVLNPGDFVGELSVIDHQPKAESLIALKESVVALIPAEITRQLFLRYSSVTGQVMEHLCKTIRRVTQIRSALAINRAQGRVYHLLLQFAKTAPDESLTIEGLPNQQTIAMMANVSRESVSRAIHALIKQNVLRKDARKLIVTSPGRLTELARGDTEQTKTTEN